MIIAENLPEDSSRNSLEKIFGVVGRSAMHITHMGFRYIHTVMHAANTDSNACM